MAWRIRRRSVGSGSEDALARAAYEIGVASGTCVKMLKWCRARTAVASMNCVELGIGVCG